jgi:flagellar hook-associated protein 1 FlgK
MSISLLSLGSRSLAAAQGSLGTIAHNIANANTPGYSRQEAVLSTATGQYTGAGYFGRGVDLTTVRRQYDQFLTQSVQTQTSQSAADAARSGALSELDGLFADPSTGIGAAMDNLFGAASDLASRPADTTARTAWLAQTGQVAQRIASVGRQLADMASRADSRIAQGAGQVNDKLGALKAINAKIAQSQAGGQPPNDLLDQRDTLLQDLNGLMAVTVLPKADGTVDLFTRSGAALLVGGQQSVLSAVPDPADASRTALKLSIGTGPTALSQMMDAASLGGGSLAGTLTFRDQDLASAVNQVGRLAVVLADRLNAQQANGVDASGVAGQAVLSVPQPQVRPDARNTGTGSVTASVSDSSRLQASDYRVDWDGSACTITRIADGQTTTTATFPATMDGLDFNAAPGLAAGDSFLVRPFAAASTGVAARTLSPAQVATGYAVTVAPSAGNKGSAAVTAFAVSAQSASTAQPVDIVFNNPATSYNVTGLASGNLINVPWTAGAAVPAAPATYNGWSLVLDGTPAAGDSFAIRPTAAPASDNRNALALDGLADLRLVDGATLNGAYASLVGDIGARVQGASDAASVSESLRAEAVSRQQNVAGVNLDEEAANLLRFQQAYQASAKIIQASQTLFDALLAVAGR